MCGIAGIFNLTNRAVLAEDVSSMTRALAHRGPDGEGIHVAGPLGLGHRRLAILDLSDRGKQPMCCVGGRYWITFNGEVYNFIELRKDLEAKGYFFYTDTDTEVIVAAYDCWGAEFLHKINGMWAFAVWDSRESTLFLARDRFGIKPLFYLCQTNRFAFASELKAFLHLREYVPRENESAMRRTLANAWSLEETEETLLEGVKRLPAGHCMKIAPSGQICWRWWSTLEHLVEPPHGMKRQAEQFRELFFDSCRLRLRSDVPIATCLSGGVDSSAVLCSLAALSFPHANDSDSERRSKDYQRAFVATFPGTPWDEEHYASMAIRHAGAQPRIRPIAPEAALQELRRFIYDFEEIEHELHYPLWSIYRELRRDGVVVSLDGHGADELLAGYTHDLDYLLKSTGNLLLSPWRTVGLLRTLYGMYGPGGPTAPPSILGLIFASDPVLRGAHSLMARIRAGGRRALGRQAGPTSNEPNGEVPWIIPLPEAEVRGNEAEERAIDNLGPFNAHLYRVFHRTTLPMILRNFDRCSMAHGIEIRMPFMDWRLVRYVFSLPAKSKVSGGFTKRVLREAMRGVMPESIRTRKSKIGFSSPMPNWFNGTLRDWIWEEVNSQGFLQSGTWNGPAIRNFVAPRHRANQWTNSDCRRVWPFLNAHLWRQVFLQGEGKAG